MGVRRQRALAIAPKECKQSHAAHGTAFVLYAIMSNVLVSKPIELLKRAAQWHEWEPIGFRSNRVLARRAVTAVAVSLSWLSLRV